MKALLLSITLATISASALAAKIEVASITPGQIESITTALQTKVKNKQTAAAVKEASGVITDFMKIESCMSGYNASPLNQFAAPGKTYPDMNYIGPMLGMKYHARDKCLTITKIHGFEMPAKNALAFEVLFTADDSGETTKRYYTVQKQDDDSWLFK